jgi:type II secretory pathway component PulF
MGLPLAVVYRNLAALHAAGVAWPEAIESATGRGDARWAGVRDATARGVGVAEAFAPVVPPLDLAGLRAGEVSGRMEALLRALAERHEEQDRRDRARRGALAYPVFVAHVAAVLLAVPDLVAGNVPAAVGWAALALVPTWLVFGLARAARRAEERGPDAPPAAWARLLRTRAATEDADARALRALGWLHDAGVPPLSAVPLARRAGAGGRVADDLARVEASVRAGRPMHEGWRDVPPAARARLENGERAGAFSPACAEVARGFEEAAADRRARFAAALKPVAVLVVGAVVAARVISFYAGYFSALPT